MDTASAHGLVHHSLGLNFFLVQSLIAQGKFDEAQDALRLANNISSVEIELLHNFLDEVRGGFANLNAISFTIFGLPLVDCQSSRRIWKDNRIPLVEGYFGHPLGLIGLSKSEIEVELNSLIDGVTDLGSHPIPILVSYWAESSEGAENVVTLGHVSLLERYEGKLCLTSWVGEFH